MWSLISQRDIIWKYNVRCDLLENSYVSYLEKNGIYVIPVPNVIDDIDIYLDSLSFVEAIILSGGNDICPSQYNQSEQQGMSNSSNRDKVENKLLNFALQKGLPVLGICRGMQFINVFFGGELIRDITKHKEFNQIHVNRYHHIDIVDKNIAPHISMKCLKVNSYHDHAVTLENLSPHLKPFAVSSGSDIVEGLYHPNLPIAGVQFHPERDGPNEFSTFIAQAFIGRKYFWEKL